MTPKGRLLPNGPGNGVKNWCTAMFYSNPINRASGAFSRWFPVLHEVQIQKSSTA